MGIKCSIAVPDSPHKDEQSRSNIEVAFLIHGKYETKNIWGNFKILKINNIQDGRNIER